MNKRIAFVLASTDHGTMIVNHLDYRRVETVEGCYTFGVGYSLLEDASYEPDEVHALLHILDQKRKHAGKDEVIAVDCGANIGTHAIPMADHMRGWGRVHAFEPQEQIYYALCGNIVINNCFNIRAYRKAVGASVHAIAIPCPDYQEPGSFGSLELRRTDKSEHIGQDLSDSLSAVVDMLSIDSMMFGRLDVLKIDVERMEMDVLDGGANTIRRCHPVIMLEWTKVDDQQKLLEMFETWDYQHFVHGRNMVAVWRGDPVYDYLVLRGGVGNG